MRKGKIKKIALLIIVVFVSLIGFFYYRRVAVPMVSDMAVELTKSKAIDAFNGTNDVLQKMQLFYNDYFEYFYNNDGELVLIKSNAPLINQISMIAQTDAQSRMGKIVGEKINVPLGAFTGSSLISAYGTEVSLEIMSVSNCMTSFKSEFKTLGINQTLHRLIINVTADISVLIPPTKSVVEVSDQIIVTENVILGRVPATFIDGEEENLNYLDLLP